jgi:hypothetical protein
MRTTTLALAALMTTGICTSGCNKRSQASDILALPSSYDPAGAELTFNKAGLEKFNALEASERDAMVEQLAASAGSFTGQALVRGSAGLGEAMPDHVHGSWEVMGTTRSPVLYEIVINYSLFTTPAIGRPLAENRAVAFTGTLISVDFKDDAKPRSLTVKVKADSITPLVD